MAKHIYIWDCDWNEDHKALYNVVSMKISSFHKQLGDEVHLASEEWLPFGNYEKLYIIRESLSAALPPMKFLDDKRTVGLGNAMQGFSFYIDLPNSIAACRPDYLLFPEKVAGMRRYEKVQYLQFTNNGKLLPVVQDAKNSFTGKKINMVVDPNLWDLDYSIIKEVLTRLQKTFQVAFKFPIKIKPLIEDEEIQKLFLSLRFDGIYREKFQNNYGNSVANIQKIIDFLSIFEGYKRFKPFKIQSITKPHSNNLEAREDLFRDFKIMDYAKQKKVRINMTIPRYPNTEFIDYFTSMKLWSNNYNKVSYIEFMTRFTTEKTIRTPQEIVNNRIEWLSYNTRQLMYLIKNYYEEIKPYIYREWGDDFFEINLNLDYIRKEL